MSFFLKVTFFLNVGCCPNIVDETWILSNIVWKKYSEKFSIFFSIYFYILFLSSFTPTKNANLCKREYNNNFKEVIW